MKRVVRWLHSVRGFVLRLIGRAPPIRPAVKAPPEILIIGGYGFGNTGDEAQLGANLARWEAVDPPVDVLVLSPHPDFTARMHDCRSALASRAILFHSNRTSDFARSSLKFRLLFWPTLARMELCAWLMRAGLSPLLANSTEAHLLATLQNAAGLHVSGGGFMTGPTRSRLWDTCLILRVCQRLGTPYFLTGQTLGIFERAGDRWLARSALRRATSISLRDPFDSKRDLIALGIEPERLTSSVDDALFCDAAKEEKVIEILAQSGLSVDQPYLAVHFHWWGMDADLREASAKRMSVVLDAIIAKYELQVLFVPMGQTDEKAQRTVQALMNRPSTILLYDYTYQVVRGVIGSARALISLKHHPLVFALGENTPCLSISFDEYYKRKNIGAMSNLDMDRFCLEKDEFFGSEFGRIFEELISERDFIRRSLTKKLLVVRRAQELFFGKALFKMGLTQLG